MWSIAAGSTTSSALDPGGNRVASASGGVTGFTLPDLHANLAAVTDSAETAIASATRYDPFGLTVATYDSGGAFPTPWKFQGRLDVSANPADPLYEFSARLYQPATATFSQLDSYAGSVQDPLSLNRYLYAAANPWTLIDPDGHRFLADAQVGPGPILTCATQDNICANAPDGANPASVHGSELNSMAVEDVVALMTGAAVGATFTTLFAAGCAYSGGRFCPVLQVGALGYAAVTLPELLSRLTDPTVPDREKQLIADQLIGALFGGSLVSRTVPLRPRAPVHGTEDFGPLRPGTAPVRPAPALGPGAQSLLERVQRVEITESMSLRAANYQAQVTGGQFTQLAPRAFQTNQFVVGGVRFDGFRDGYLVDAKGPGFGNFVSRAGDWYEWFRGAISLAEQARRQSEAAAGAPIKWYVADWTAYPLISRIGERWGIEVIHQPYRP